MKFSIYTVVVALAAYAAADTFEDNLEEFNTLEARGNPPKCDGAAKKIPKCARGPITKCTKQAGCGARDYKCGCKNKKQITACAQNPVIAKCGTKGALKARAAAKKLCKCAT